MITPDLVREAIAKALHQRTEVIVKEEAEKAAAEVRRRVSALTGEIATTVTQRLSYEMRGTDITISVRFP